jgi:hypothetical protein
VTVAQPRQVRFEISAELYGEFRGLLSDEAIRGGVREAMTDLCGSISREALPEMAVRLARARLARRLSHEQPDNLMRSAGGSA